MRGSDANKLVRVWEQQHGVIANPDARYELVHSIAEAIEAGYIAGVACGDMTARADVRKRLGL